MVLFQEKAVTLKPLKVSKFCRTELFPPCNVKENIIYYILKSMSYDIFQSVSQGVFGAQDAENRRIKAIADELHRCCKVYETEHGDRMSDVSSFEIGFCNDNGVGHYSNSSFIVWDLIPRNVLSDKDGDIFVVDAEIKRK